MSLNWNWEDKIGYAEFEKKNSDGKFHPYKVNIYKGNAFIIALHEYKENGEDYYSMSWFFTDKEHARRCLKDDMFKSEFDHPTKFVLNRSKEAEELCKILMKYLNNVAFIRVEKIEEDK